METHHIFREKKRKSSSKQETEWDHQLPSRFLCRTSFEVIIQSSDVQREEKVTRNHPSPLMNSSTINHDQNGQGNEVDSENDKTTSTQRSDGDSKTVSLSSLSSESSIEKPKTFRRTSNCSEAAAAAESDQKKKTAENPNSSQLPEHSQNSHSCSRNSKARIGESGLFSNKFADSKSNFCNKRKSSLSSSSSHSSEKYNKVVSPFRMDNDILTDSQKNIMAGGDFVQSETEDKNSAKIPENSQLNKPSGIFLITHKDANKQKAAPPTEESSYSDPGLKNDNFLNKPFNIDNDFDNMHGLKLQHQMFIDKESKSSSKLEGGGNIGDFTLGPISDSHKGLKGMYRLSMPPVKSEQESHSSEEGGSFGFDITQEFPMQSAESSSFDTDTGRESVATLNTYHSGEGSGKWKLSVTDLVEYFENLNSETDMQEKIPKTDLAKMNFACNGSEEITENFLDCNKNKRKLYTEKRCFNNGKDSNNATCKLINTFNTTCNTFNLRRRCFNNDGESKSSDLLYHKEDRKIEKCDPVDDHNKNREDLMDFRMHGFHHTDKLKESASIHIVPKVDLLHISKPESLIPLLENRSLRIEMEHSKESRDPQTVDNTQQCPAAATPESVQLEISKERETTEDPDSYSNWLMLTLVYLLQYVCFLLYRKY